MKSISDDSPMPLSVSAQVQTYSNQLAYLHYQLATRVDQLATRVAKRLEASSVISDPPDCVPEVRLAPTAKAPVRAEKKSPKFLSP